MADPIHLTVHGLPAPQGSKRHVGGGVMIETGGAKLKAWRDAVRVDAALGMAGRPPLVGPVAVHVTFMLPRPKSHYRTGSFAQELKSTAPTLHSSKPDLDKLVRSTLDGLKAGGVYLDDSQVSSLHTTKRYTGGAPMAMLSIIEDRG